MSNGVDLPAPYFVARPIDKPRAGVVVVMEGNGMGWQLLRVCERFARLGYLAIAPDVFHRFAEGHGDWEQAFSSLRHEDALSDIRECVTLLHEQGVERVGITGFCMGGRLTYLAATSDVPVDAAAPFYGGGIDQILGVPGCPLLAFFGGSDPYVPMEAIRRVQDHHGENVVIYPDADHGFMRDGSETYHPTAAPDAWTRLLAFFEQNLG